MLTYTATARSCTCSPGAPSTRSRRRRTGKQVAFKLAYDGGYQRYYTDNPTVQATLRELRDLQGQSGSRDGRRRTTRRAGRSGRRSRRPTRRSRGCAARPRTTGRRFTCPTYDGPALADLVAACKAPDGSYWAVQSWDRDLPDYGVDTDGGPVADGDPPLPLDGRAARPHRPRRLGLRRPVEPPLGHLHLQRHGRLRLPARPRRASRSTASGATSTSTPTTPPTGRAGGGRTASSRTSPAAPGATASTRTAPTRRAPDRSTALTILGPGVTPDVSVTVPAPGRLRQRPRRRPTTRRSKALNDPKCQPH